MGITSRLKMSGTCRGSTRVPIVRPSAALISAASGSRVIR